MPVATQQDRFSLHFASTRRAYADEPSWLGLWRDAAYQRFVDEGFPTTRDEEWRATNVSALGETPYASPLDAVPSRAADTAAAVAVPHLDAAQLVFLNGRLAPELSSVGALPPGVVVSSLAAAVGTDGERVRAHLGVAVASPQRGFTALNGALFLDGAYVHVPAGVMVGRPIHLVHLGGLGAAVAAHPRTLIVVDARSEVQIVETYAGAAGEPYFTNALTEIVVGAQATVRHCRVQRESLAAGHVSSTHVALAGRGVFESQNIVLGGGTVRNDVNATLGGEGITCTLDGLYLADGRRLVDNHTAIDHAKPHCQSHELYKGIIDGHGRGVFNGKIFVRQDAQKTDAKQTNQVLLLSDDATINTKPQLEIFADDVKCTHGATVGQLDDEALFYLRARGIGRDEARALLIQAFAIDVIDRVPVESLRRTLEAALLDRLPRGPQGA
ncbi:MAG: Fe-S cluster assembly protein SufD [Vicinamibacterales bacterium]